MCSKADPTCGVLCFAALLAESGSHISVGRAGPLAEGSILVGCSRGELQKQQQPPVRFVISNLKVDHVRCGHLIKELTLGLIQCEFRNQRLVNKSREATEIRKSGSHHTNDHLYGLVFSVPVCCVLIVRS